MGPVLSCDLELWNSSCLVSVVVGGKTAVIPAAEQTTDEDEEETDSSRCLLPKRERERSCRYTRFCARQEVGGAGGVVNGQKVDLLLDMLISADVTDSSKEPSLEWVHSHTFRMDSGWMQPQYMYTGTCSLNPHLTKIKKYHNTKKWNMNEIYNGTPTFLQVKKSFL